MSSASSVVADHARVGRRAALPFELFHLDDDFVDGRLQELERRRREMRQVAFGGGACDIQFGRGAAGGFENVAALLDENLVLVGAGPARGDGLVGVANVLLQSLERAHVRVEPGLAGGDGGVQVVDAAARLVAFGRERARPRFELGARFLEPLHLGGQRGRALDEGRVGGAGFGRALAEILGGLARLEQAALRGGQPIVGRPLIVFQPGDRFARFALTPVDRLALLFGLPALAAELLVLQGEAGRLVLSVLQLRLLRHDRLFLLVVLGRQGRDRIRRLGDRRVERRGFRGEAGKGLALSLDPPAQFLDFALGLENPASLLVEPARDEIRSAEHVAVGRHDRQLGEAAAVSRAVVRVGDPRIPDRALNRAAIRAADAHDGRQRHDALGRRRVGPAPGRRGRVRRLRGGNQEPAAAGAGFAHQAEPCGRMLRVFDDDVLEQVREAGLDCPLVPVIHFEVVRDRALLRDLAVGLRQQRARGVSVAGAGGFELLE